MGFISEKIKSFVLVTLLLLAGCSGGSFVQPTDNHGDGANGMTHSKADSSAAPSAPGQGFVLLGAALLPDKSKHAGITIKLSGNGVEQTATTDAGGNFSFSSVPPGLSYQIVASYGADYRKAMKGDITVKQNGLNRVDTIALAAKPGTINGVVTLQGSDSHVGFVYEDLVSGASLTQVNPALNGAFSFRGVPAGKRIIRLFKPGFEALQVVVDVPANGTVTLDPVELSSQVGSLDATFTLEGAPSTLEGAPSHEGIWIMLENKDKSLYYSGKTDMNGRVRIEGMRAGAYRLVAKKAVTDDLIIDPVVIKEGEATSLPNKAHTAATLTMLKGTIAGVVQLKTIVDYNGGNILYDTSICYGCFVVTQGPMTITDTKGRFLLGGVSMGAHSIHVDYETCITGLHDTYKSPDFSITDALPVHSFEQPIPLFESTGGLAGVALLAGQTEHSDIVVAVEGLTGYFTLTDAQGNYKMPSVPARNKRFRLTFTKAGYSVGVQDDVIVYKDLETPLAKVTLERPLK